MNRTAYFTTDLAIKTLSKLLKARTVFHGLGNLPEGPIIFVINHFTRLETLLLPYYLYHLTGTRIWSLANDQLFNSSTLKSYFDRVGVVSTKDPQRDQQIIRTLLTGQAHWIIFPEGRMVKTKKMISGGEFLIDDGTSSRPPHTGAASLALRAEIFRRFLLRNDDAGSGLVLTEYLGLKPDEAIASESVKVVPINLTYYPIRAQENILSEFAARYVKAPSERLLEELMTEGTMMLEGVDIDMQFGTPLDAAEELHGDAAVRLLEGPVVSSFKGVPETMTYLQNTAATMMHTYMERIYRATTVNHDHLFASLLRRHSFRPFTFKKFARSVYLVSDYLRSDDELVNGLHSSLTESQLHLLVDDRHQKVRDFIALSLSTGSLVQEHQQLRKDSTFWQTPPLFHRARVRNPAEVMANEIEPLERVQRYISRVSRIPDWLARIIIARRLFKKARQSYQDERQLSGETVTFEEPIGAPFLLPSPANRVGVLLVHSYLSVPQEMRECGELFRKSGAWVYGVRLPGHGTTPEALAVRKWEEWRSAVEQGYVLLDSLCRTVVLVGFSAGGSLVLELASRLDTLAGVVAVCPPFVLQDYSKRFMPPIHIWDRLLARLKGSSKKEEFVDFDPEIGSINYRRNPVTGVLEVGKLLTACKDSLPDLHHRSLVISADQDQVVGSSCGTELFSHIGSRDKAHLLLSSEQHNIIYGPDGGQARKAIASFVRDCQK